MTTLTPAQRLTDSVPDLSLVALHPSNAALLAGWLSDSSTLQTVTLDVPYATNEQQAQKIIEQQLEDQNAWFFMVHSAVLNEPVGYVGVGMIDQKNRTGCLGIVVSEQQRRSRHVGRQALQLAIDFAFDELNLHRVWGEVLSFNRAALAICAYCGMKQEGVKREACFRRGSYHDVIQLGLLRQEWKGSVHFT